MVVLLGLLTLTLLVGVGVGSVYVPPLEGVRILVDRLPFISQASDPVHDTIIWSIRLPRVLLAGLVGSVLALSGGVMQGIFRNPLADPYLLGIASGSTAGVALTVVLGLDGLPLVLPIGAFSGGLLVVTLVYRIAHAGAQSRLDNFTLILAGVALAALFSAITSFLLYVSNPEDIRKIVFWVMGGLGGARWSFVYPVLGVTLVGGTVLLLFARDLNALALGEEMAQHLGISPALLKKLLLGVATLMTAAVVSVAGTIGFVGLIVPHALRLLVGPDHRVLLPAAGLAGAILLILCDAGARIVLAPAELPVGIITAVLGAPFFLYLLHRSKNVRFTGQR